MSLPPPQPDHDVYPWSPITERPVVPWPDGRRVAVYVGLNVERFRVDLVGAGTHDYSGSGERAPDPRPREHAWYSYGTRVGIWRMIELFDSCGVPVSAITNSDVVTRYPQIVEAGLAREWAWVGHGETNSLLHAGLSEQREAEVLDRIVATFAGAGIRPRGWLGPGLTETWATPRLLAERGFDYTLDWIADDRPFPLTTPGMWSVPYGMDINDAYLFSAQSTTPWDYERIVLDQLEVLLAEGGGVLALPVHPHRVGVPHRFKYFARVVRAIAAHPDVWLTTSHAIADHYREHARP